MGTPYIGEIRIFGGNFAPAGWALCNGQLLPIDQYDALFNLIGTTYGGDGQSTFGLPNLQGRLAIHPASGFVMGQRGGAENVTLTSNMLPSHSHAFQASKNAGTQANPPGNVPATIAVGASYIYHQSVPNTPLAPDSIQSTPVGSQPHYNMQPYQCVSFIISLFGVYPSPT